MPLTVTCQDAFDVGLKFPAPFVANVIIGKIFQIPENSDDLLKWSCAAALAAYIATLGRYLMRPCCRAQSERDNLLVRACCTPHSEADNYLEAVFRSGINTLVFHLGNWRSFKREASLYSSVCAGFGISLAFEVLRVCVESYISCCPEREDHPRAQPLINASSRSFAASSLQIGEGAGGSVFQVVPAQIEGSGDGGRFLSLKLSDEEPEGELEPGENDPVYQSVNESLSDEGK